MTRSQIDRIPTDTPCTLLLSSGHTIHARKDDKESTDGPSGWYVFFYERAATGRGRVREWSISGNSIVAISLHNKAED